MTHTLTTLAMTDPSTFDPESPASALGMVLALVAIPALAWLARGLGAILRAWQGRPGTGSQGRRDRAVEGHTDARSATVESQRGSLARTEHPSPGGPSENENHSQIGVVSGMSDLSVPPVLSGMSDLPHFARNV